MPPKRLTSPTAAFPVCSSVYVLYIDHTYQDFVYQFNNIYFINEADKKVFIYELRRPIIQIHSHALQHQLNH